MALLSIYRGTQAEVSKRPVSDGALLFATDTKKIYLDKGSSRVEMSSLQDLSDYVTNEELTEGLATKAPLSHSHTTAQVTGLDSALAGKASTGHTHAAATDAAAGFMSAADKEKLDGIASGANKYTLPTATSSVLGGVKTGANITNSSGTISLTKANVTAALGYTPPTTDTNTWTAFKGASTSAAGTAGYVPAPTAGAANRYFRSDGTWTVPPDTNTNTTYTLTKSGSTITLTGSDGKTTSVTDSNTTYSLSSFGVTATATELNYMDGVTSNVQTQLNGKAASSHSHSTATTSAAGFLRQLNGSTANFLRGDGTWATPPNTTYSVMKGATSSAAGSTGLVPAPAAGKQTSFLRGDGTWVVPTNTTYGLATTSANGLLRQLSGSTSQYLRGDGTWATPTATIADGSITAAKLADGAVTSAKIADGTIAAGDVGFNYALGATKGGNAAMANDLRTVRIITSSVDWNTLTDTGQYMVTMGTLAGTNIPTGAYGFGTLLVFKNSGNHVAQIYLPHRAGGVVYYRYYFSDVNWIAWSAIGNVPDGSITTAKIATNAVTADGIAAGAVGTSELAANAVTLAKLGSDVGTVAVQSSTPSDTNVKLWIQI